MNTKKSNLDLIDIHNHVGVDLLFYLNGHHPYAQSWLVLAKEAEANGIGMLGVFPMVSHLALGIEGMRRGVVDFLTWPTAPFRSGWWIPAGLPSGKSRACGNCGRPPCVAC